MSVPESYDPSVRSSDEGHVNTHGLVLNLLEQGNGHLPPPNSPTNSPRAVEPELPALHGQQDQGLQAGANNAEELSQQLRSTQTLLTESYTIISAFRAMLPRVGEDERREFIESLITREALAAAELMNVIQRIENQLRELQMMDEDNDNGVLMDENSQLEISQTESMPSLMSVRSNSSNHFNYDTDVESESDDDLTPVSTPRNSR